MKKKTKNAIAKAFKAAAKAAIKALQAVRFAYQEGTAWARLAIRVQLHKSADRPGYAEALICAVLTVADLLLDSQRLKLVAHRVAAAALGFIGGHAVDLYVDLDPGYWS